MIKNLLFCCVILCCAGGCTCNAEEPKTETGAVEAARKAALLAEIAAQPKGQLSVVLVEVSTGDYLLDQEEAVWIPRLPESQEAIQKAIDDRPGLKLVREHLASDAHHELQYLVMLVFEKQ